MRNFRKRDQTDEEHKEGSYRFETEHRSSDSWKTNMKIHGGSAAKQIKQIKPNRPQMKIECDSIF